MCKLIYQKQVHFLALQKVFIACTYLGCITLELCLRGNVYVRYDALHRTYVKPLWITKHLRMGKRAVFSSSRFYIFNFYFFGSCCCYQLNLLAAAARETTSSGAQEKKSLMSWGVWIFCGPISRRNTKRGREMHYALSPSWFIMAVVH